MPNNKFPRKQLPVTPAQKRHQFVGLVATKLGTLLQGLSEANLDQLIEERDTVTSAFHDIIRVVSISPEERAYRWMIDSAIAEYQGYIRTSLDTETVISSTIDYILNKIGLTNLAVFLPVTDDEFTLGGYANHDMSEGSPEFLLNDLADIIALEVEDTLHLTTDAELQRLFGDSAVYLTGSHLFAIACVTQGEVLAILILFRSGENHFVKEGLDIIKAIAPVFAERLAKIWETHFDRLK